MYSFANIFVFAQQPTAWHSVGLLYQWSHSCVTASPVWMKRRKIKAVTCAPKRSSMTQPSLVSLFSPRAHATVHPLPQLRSATMLVHNQVVLSSTDFTLFLSLSYLYLAFVLLSIKQHFSLRTPPPRPLLPLLHLKYLIYMYIL